MDRGTFEGIIANVRRTIETNPFRQTAREIEESISILQDASNKFQEIEDAIQEEFSKSQNKSAGKKKLG
jgi:hypothetical protein